MPSRIDVHQHIIPAQWRQAIAAQKLDSGWPIPPWTADSAIAMMDRQHIATGILSVSTPRVHLGDDSQARELARSVNEYAAEIVKDRPDRFGWFASVPLPDSDTTVAEAVHALDVLHADGIILLSNAHGRYLGDPRGSDWPFAPEWAGAYHNRFLEGYSDFAPGQAEAIDRGNAKALSRAWPNWASNTAFIAPTAWRVAMGTSCTGPQACAFAGGTEGGTNAEDYHT